MEKNVNANITRLVIAALFTALCCVTTMAVPIPSPMGGYLNPGDAIVLLSAFFLGPFWGAAAAGLGSFLADIFSGYAIWAPATLVIKALMALVSGALLRRMENKNKVAAAILAGVAAELIMIVGYFLYTATFLRVGLGALADVPGNIVQGVFGIAAGTALFLALSQDPLYQKPDEIGGISFNLLEKRTARRPSFFFAFTIRINARERTFFQRRFSVPCAVMIRDLNPPILGTAAPPEGRASAGKEKNRRESFYILTSPVRKYIIFVSAGSR